MALAASCDEAKGVSPGNGVPHASGAAAQDGGAPEAPLANAPLHPSQSCEDPLLPPEPASLGEPDPEPDPEADPEPDPEADPEPDPEADPEPEPELELEPPPSSLPSVVAPPHAVA
jgi:hypothetical protein